MRARTQIVLSLIAAAVCVVIFFCFKSLRSGADAEGRSPPQWAIEQSQAWSSVPFLPLPAPDDTSLSNNRSEAVEKLASQLDADVEDSSHAASTAVRGALCRTLANQLVARSRATGREYVENVDHECARWLDASDVKDWRSIDSLTQESLGKIFDHSDAHAALEAIAENLLTENRGRLRTSAHGKDGCRIILFHARSEVEMQVRLMKETDTRPDYWFGASHSADMLRKPQESLDQVLHRDTTMLAAVVLMLVETQDGHRYDWVSMWFWNPAQNCWGCHQMSRSGGTYSHWMYY